MQPPSEPRARVAALDDAGMAWAQRVLWVVCIGVYLTVFISGIQGGGAELIAVARAAGFTLVAALLGKLALNLLGTASLPVEPGPMANEAGHLGSLGDLIPSPNVPQQRDEALVAANGER